MIYSLLIVLNVDTFCDDKRNFIEHNFLMVELEITAVQILTLERTVLICKLFNHESYLYNSKLISCIKYIFCRLILWTASGLTEKKINLTSKSGCGHLAAAYTHAHHFLENIKTVSSSIVKLSSNDWKRGLVRRTGDWAQSYQMELRRQLVKLS